MKVFITGATGFIGTHLVQRLAGSGHEMRCLVRRPGPANARLEALGATLVGGDVTDKASLSAGMQGCDRVMHLAGLYSFWEPDKRAYAAVDVEGTRNVMECALETGVSKVVHVSTAGIYGKPADCPFTEDSTPGPVQFSAYFRGKHLGDQIAWDLHAKKGLPLVIICPGSVLGAGDTKASGEYIVNLMRRRLPARIFEDGTLTFVHVGDVAEAIVRAADKEDNVGARYLVGKHRLSFRELNQMVGEIAGVALPRLSLPDSMVIPLAAFLTGLADLTKKPPLWGLALDQARVMQQGFQFDGSKAERDLGISYTPIRVALEEAIASYR